MRSNTLKATMKAAIRILCILLLATGVGFAQVNLTAGPSTLAMPDGQTVLMWGYSCGTAVANYTATCAKLNLAATGWSPVVITVQAGTPLEIDLTNNLTFPVGSATPTASIPTSLVIVGQLGGGLGTAATYVASPNHADQPTTWAVAGDTNGATFNPPVQGQRVQSFATEVTAGTGKSTALTWTNLKPGTYLLESGTHPSIQAPMGLYGIVVVTAAPGSGVGNSTATTGLAYLNVNYNAELPLLLSEIDPLQNAEVNTAVNTPGFSETASIVLRDSVSSVALATDANGNPIAGTGYKVGDKVTLTGGGVLTTTATAQVGSVDASGAITGISLTGAGSNYTSIPNAVVTSATGSGAQLAVALSLAGDLCSTGGSGCYPPAVNYSPLYYMINGVAFTKNNPGASVFAALPNSTAVSGTVLVRMVNAGLKMHVPSIVGSATTQLGVKAPNTPITGGGFSLIAEDGNPLPGVSRIQSEVFMAPGKTYDVMINVPPAGSNALPIYDRELSLSGNASERDAGMLAYISVNGGSGPASPTVGATATADTYNVVPGNTLTISDISKGLIANDINVYGVALSLAAGSAPAHGALTLNANGTFTYVPDSTWSGTTSATTSDSFTYMANGIASVYAVVTLQACTTSSGCMDQASGITVNNITYTSNVATFLKINSPGVLSVDSDALGYPLTVNLGSVKPQGGLSLNADVNGGFTASVTAPGTYTFTYQAQNSQGTLSANTATVTIIFPTPSNLKVSVVDGVDKTTAVPDYRWIIEEDKTFYIDPGCQSNPPPTYSTVNPTQLCPTVKEAGGTQVTPTLGVNFHTSDMPFVAQGCVGSISCEAGQTVFDPTTGTHVSAVCDQGNGVCRTDATQEVAVDPSQVHLDPTKRYYISVLPGDAANAFISGNTQTECAGNAANCGHGMGGASVAAGQTAVTILAQPNPYPPGKLSVFVFEDDFPLNGEVDSGGGVDVLAPNEPGLGGFNIQLWDAMGGNNDFTGQMTYDMFNQPLSNSLAGTIDPATKMNACPISGSSSTAIGKNGVSATATGAGNTINISGLTVDPSQVGNIVVITGGTNFNPGTYTIGSVDVTAHTWTLIPADPTLSAASGAASGLTGSRSQPGITGMIVTCPKYESDGITLSPLAGQAVVENLMPGRFGVIATPAADRIARGEQWLQTNTLDGQKAHDSFIKIGEPSYFQEYGPANFHVTIGFANPQIINNRLASVCAGTDVYLPGQGNCTYELKGKVTGERLSRTPDERLYSSSTRDAFAWTQCYVSIGDPDGEDFAFTKCNADGTFDFKGLPQGQWRVTTFDQWNDQLVDGLSTPVALSGNNPVVNLGDVAATQWQTNIQTRTFIDDNHDGVSQSTESGIPFLNVAVRYRDGSLANLLGTDFSGVANFNETFPLFAWYTIETDVTRYKNTGTHVIYDAGGPADNSASCGGQGYPPCGNSKTAANLANTNEQYPLPASLSVPGSVYCTLTDTADCNSEDIRNGQKPSSNSATTSTISTGRIDNPYLGGVEGWQGYPGQFEFVEFGKAPYDTGENGGIKGHVVYASTRPFDDPQMLVQTQWEPLVPHVTINLYQELTAPDGTKSLKLADTTQTSSWDDWAQGFRSDGVPNMNCPGQSTSDLFYFTLYNQPQYLDYYNNVAHGTVGTAVALPDNSQFKCYDGMHNWNQVQPAPYDGMYAFPSITGLDPKTGLPTGTNCTICLKNPESGVPTAPNYDPFRAGQPMLPPGKYVVEVVVPPGYELVKEEDKNILIGDNFIAPVSQQFGGLGDIFILPDQASVAGQYNSNNPQNPTESLGANPENGIVPGFTPEPVWPCVGASRIVPDYISLYPQSQQVSPFAGATRNLCDRKEVTLNDQAGAIAKFYIFTSTHRASKFYGGITDDFTSEFDPFSPQFGEKFAPPNLPVAIRDWNGSEISRVYADSWGAYNGMTYSTWEVNPPNPTGYSPTMMVFCMNDPGPMMNFATAQPLTDANGKTITDPSFNPGYSQFCYELPYMPAQTQYLDTPVVPTSAFSEGYNHPDCSYPTLTPSISEVDGDASGGDSKGPWVKTAGAGAVGTVAITSGGNGYSSAPTVTFTGGGGTAATGTATIAPNGQVAAVIVSVHGSGYTSTPTVIFNGGGGNNAAGTAIVSGSVNKVTVAAGGTYIALPPTVTFGAPAAGGTTATGTVIYTRSGFLGLQYTVTGVTITNPGSGYTVAPAVTFSTSLLGASYNAKGTDTITSGVQSVTLTNPGSGYTSAPTVSFSGGGGSGAVATSTLGSVVTAVNVINGGSGYTGAPTVVFSGGGGTGAAGTASLATGGILTITSLGDATVINNAYSGPSATKAPFNQKTITRHYGFGTCSVVNGACADTGSLAKVTIGGITAPIVNWSDSTIKVQVPAGIPACALQQSTKYGGSPAKCGQLVITNAAGVQSIDTVTVTVGGKAPTHVVPGTSLVPGIFGPVQAAIDAASPGDMIIVDPGTYYELLIMWKPVRLQGVGAASTVINANTQPAGKLDPWRARISCLFGLSLNGQPASLGNPVNGVYQNAPSPTNTNPFDPTNTYTCGGWNGFNGVLNNPQVDRLPLEGVLGWDTTTNGNLAQLLQEPTLMGAYEGAGITVLSKGVNVPANATSSYYGSGAEATFPTGTTLLTNANCSGSFPSNFQCNPSSIDGLSVTDSSQGGGGIFLHAWAHNMQIANNRVYNNIGTLSGGINIGQGESPDAYLQGTVNDTDPGSCIATNVTNQQLPYCFDMNVNVHNNYVALNTSIGDELFSGTPAGAGGVSFCTGADYYKFNFNWICGNMSTGDGGGVSHLGFIWNGDIEHNSILFNQSTNPTIQTNGGGIVVMGAAPDGAPPGSPAGTECGGTVADADCTPGLADGTGPNLLINANLIQGNAAESGSGGGIRLQGVNGTELANFVNQPQYWNSVTLTNNIIVNNVAGWDGGGVSLQDALNVNMINNTIASNDATASAGPLFNTIGSPLASAPNPTLQTTGSTKSSFPEVAGVVTMQHSPQLLASLTTSLTCPAGHSSAGTAAKSDCNYISYPLLWNNVLWQNRSFSITTGGYSNAFQQNQIAMLPMLSQSATGQCVSGANYWDIGVRGDAGPSNSTSGYKLSPVWSVITDVKDYANTANGKASNNTGSNPEAMSQYCNGSRVPPENGGLGYNVPPGISDATVPNPIFNLTPAATVDEGNNWVNISWGPLTMINPVDGVTPLGNYALEPYSPAVDYVPVANNQFGFSIAGINVPSTDFYGNPRPDTGNTTKYDVGAIEYKGAASASASVAPTTLAFGDVTASSTSPAQTLTVYRGAGNLSGITVNATAPFVVVNNTCTGQTLTATNTSCTIGIALNPTTVPAGGGATTGTATITANAGVAGSPVHLSGFAVAQVSVTPGTLILPDTAIGSTSTAQTVTVTNGTAATITNLAAVASQDYTVASSTCGTTLATLTSCTYTVSFKPTVIGLDPGTLTVSSSIPVVGSPVSLTANGLGSSVAPSALAFGNVSQNYPSAVQTLTVTNSSATALKLTAITVTAPFSRPTGAAGGTCSLTTNLAAATAANPSTCTINVIYTPTTLTSSTGSVTITGTYGANAATITGSPVTLTGAGVALEALPNLSNSVLDNFNRRAATTLGTNWLETTGFRGASIDIVDTATRPTIAGLANANGAGTAYWNAIDPISGVGVIYGSKEAAAYTFSDTTTNGDSLILDATGVPSAANIYPNFVKVAVSGTRIVAVTTTRLNSAGASVTSTPVTLSLPNTAPVFANGDTITAVIDGTTAMGAPTVFVWRTSSTAVTTPLGAVQVPVNQLWQLGGQIGMQLPAGARVDNFAGGNVQ